MRVRADGMSSGEGGKEKPLGQCERQDKAGGENQGFPEQAQRGVEETRELQGKVGVRRWGCRWS